MRTLQLLQQNRIPFVLPAANVVTPRTSASVSAGQRKPIFTRYGDRDGASLSSFALRTVLGGHQSTGRTCLAASKPPRWQNCSRHPLEELHLARGFARAAPVRTNSGKTKFNCKHPIQYIDAVQCHRLQCDWGASCRQNAAILTVFGNSSPFSPSLYLYRDSVLMACVSEVS